MLRLASDADVHGDLVRGLRRRMPELVVVRVQDVLPQGRSDPEVLRWSAANDFVLISNDRSTMIAHATQRIAAGEPMPGLIVSSKPQPIGEAIEDVLLIAACMSEGEVRSQGVVYLPL